MCFRLYKTIKQWSQTAGDVENETVKQTYVVASLLTAFSIIIGSLSIVGMANINTEVTNISTNWLPAIKVVGELGGMVGEYRRNEFAHILTSDEVQMRGYEKSISDLSTKIDAKVKEYEKLISEPEEKAAFPKFLAAWESYTKNHLQVEELSKQNKNGRSHKLV